MKKLSMIILLIAGMLIMPVKKANAQLAVLSVPNPQSIATDVETTATAANTEVQAINTKIQTALQDVRNADAVKEAMAAYNQFQTYQNYYYTATGFIQNLKSLDGMDSFLQNYKQFIPSVPTGTPNASLDNSLVNYVNGLGNSDLNAANPWDSALGVNSTAQDTQQIEESAINSESSTAALDSKEAQTATTAGHLISQEATKANGLDAERLTASANGKIIELLSEILQNQAVQNQANAAETARRLRDSQKATYQQKTDMETNQSLATSLAAGW
ncbi:MAG: hypothetical protein EVJ46_00065 [Candidatus Acididesulfobacter guangdongensis]|uniref:Uncharacterized protein n=1 Tax=Acididesulfobacter guangdongensis TaxID=2597225 RepID=A0A519BHC4_ACIG2|nr:MAG: hypothetical protein EVJ46_00065 [Candidatus Acididesulfobacter guangdongensis]